MTDAAIACHGLTKRYRRGFSPFTAVENLELTVPRGATFGLLGPNGAGKTTTIQMLLGLIFPSGGSAEVLGRPVGALEARRQIGFVPEKFQLPPFLTAQEFLEIHGRLFGLTGPTLEARISEGLERVGLTGRRKDRVGGFSKGMQQRLVLAQALLHEPALLILDEPTSALDPVGRKEVRDIIRDAHARGATVLLNSHLLSEVEAVCDQVAIMRGGKLLRQGSIRTLAGKALQVDARVKGWSSAVEGAIAPLIAHLQVQPIEGAEITQLSFEVAAEEDLPRIVRAVLDAGADMYAFAPHAESLESLFMRLMEDQA